MPKCAECGETPEYIQEYIHEASPENDDNLTPITPSEWVIRHEGTYNRANDLFWCTKCYIKIGMPLGKPSQSLSDL